MTFLGYVTSGHIKPECMPNLGRCSGFFSVRTARYLVSKLDGQIALHKGKRLRNFPIFFLALFGVPAKISGTISLYGHFLDNGS